MKEMKIAFLSAYSGPVKRGVESWTDELASRLAKDHQIKVFQLGESKDEPYQVRTVPIKVNWNHSDATDTLMRKLDLDYWSIMLGRFTLRLLTDLIKFNPDIVLPLNGSWQWKIMSQYRKYSKAKLVLVGHWQDEKAIKANPDLFVAINDEQNEWAKKNFKNRVITIYNAVDTDKYNPQGNKYPLDLPHPRILTVGQITKGKNIEETLLAVSKIPNVSLIICGDGPKEKLEKLGNKKMPGRFEILKLEQKDMPSLYRSCDLFVFVPDRSEAFGIVYLEALASGLGVVAVDDDRRKIVEEAGVFVKDAKKIQVFTDAIKKALKTEWGNRPRLQADKFSWDSTAKKYEEEFLRLSEETK